VKLGRTALVAVAATAVLLARPPDDPARIAAARGVYDRH
jgi:hypothetical protein